MAKQHLALAAILVFPYLAGAEDRLIIPPNSAPPQVAVATATEEKGIVQVRVSLPRMIPYQVTVKVPVTRLVRRDGEDHFETTFREETRTEYKGLMEAATLTVDGKEVKVSRKDGKSIDPKELPKLLAKRTRVLLVTDKELDPYYLEVFNDQVLIITVPASKWTQAKSKE